MVFGSREVNMPSGFISDIPEELTEEAVFGEDGIPRKPLIDISW
jgi:hypothetical protein